MSAMYQDQAGYCVLESTGEIFLWEDYSASRYAFVIYDDDQQWDGGFGLGTTIRIADDDPRITPDDRERLEAILTEFRSGCLLPEE